jgi:hypothetical protein
VSLWSPTVVAAPQSIESLIHRRDGRSEVSSDHVCRELGSLKTQHLLRNVATMSPSSLVREFPAVGVSATISSRNGGVLRVENNDANRSASNA